MLFRSLATALTSVQRSEGELVGHTPDAVMALYMTDKWLESGQISSSRRSLKGRSSPEAKEREEQERSKRRALKDTPMGNAMFGNDGPY